MIQKASRHHACTWLLVAAIVFLSLYPLGGVEPPIDVPLADKWAHMLMYGTLCAAFWAEHLMKHGRPAGLRAVAGGLLLPVALGGMMELAQAWLTTYRSGDWMDFLANTIGALLANAAVLAVLAVKRSRG